MYVGNLPDGCTETELEQFFGEACIAANLNKQEGSPVTSFWLSSDKKYGFCEFRSPEEAGTSLELNGIYLKDKQLKVFGSLCAEADLFRSADPTTSLPPSRMERVFRWVCC